MTLTILFTYTEWFYRKFKQAFHNLTTLREREEKDKERKKYMRVYRSLVLDQALTACLHMMSVCWHHAPYGEEGKQKQQGAPDPTYSTKVNGSP